MKAHNWSKFCQLSFFLSDFNKNDGTQTSHPVTRDAYQSWILSSPHAERSHSVAADNGPVVRQDRGQNLHRGVKPSGWRVTVYNAGVSPFHALILSIVPELSQLPIYRASKDHVTLPHPLFAKRPAFLPPPCFTVFFSEFPNTHYARYLALHSTSISHSITLYLLALFLTGFMIRHCKQRVHCAHTDLVSLWCWLFCLWESPWWIEVPLVPAMCASGHFHSPSLGLNSLQTTTVFVWCIRPALLSLQESTVNVVTSQLCFVSTNYWLCGGQS